MKVIYTYFATCEEFFPGLVKIGVSDTPESRRKSIPGSMPFMKVKMEFTIEGHYEKILHKHYDEFWADKEWFRIPLPSKEFVEELIALERQKEVKIPTEVLPPREIKEEERTVELEDHSPIKVEGPACNLVIRTLYANRINGKLYLCFIFNATTIYEMDLAISVWHGALSEQCISLGFAESSENLKAMFSEKKPKEFFLLVYDQSKNTLRFGTIWYKEKNKKKLVEPK